MAEVPEHLLRRAQQRRSSLEGKPVETEDASAAAAAESVVNAPAGGTLAQVGESPETETGSSGGGDDGNIVDLGGEEKDRDRIPWWIVPVLVALPLVALLYAGAFGERHGEDEELDPMAMGQQVWNQAGCSGCHGTDGSGGAGPQLNEGSVAQTFTSIEEIAEWDKAGSPAEGTPYGNPDREGGQRISGWFGGAMPAFGGVLSDEELEAVATYIWVTFGEQPAQ